MPQHFALGNGLTEARVYNSRLQPTSITVTDTAPEPDEQLLGLYFDYGGGNNNGNVLNQTITAPGLSARSINYSYDGVNRLTRAIENPVINPEQCPDAGSSWCEKYGYDRYGNRWVAGSSGLTQLSVTPTNEAWFNARFNENPSVPGAVQRQPDCGQRV